MVNNSNDINKTNSHLSPPIIKHITTTINELNTKMAWDRHKDVAGLNWWV